MKSRLTSIMIVDMSRSANLAYLLRHDKKYDFPHNGWRSLKELYVNYGYNVEELENIVNSDKKGRFEFDDLKTCIRARYGHSVDVFPDATEESPPDTLYHGTSSLCLSPIMTKGICKMNRRYVHLSTSIDEALEVGARHGLPILLEIDTTKMREDGIRFWKARNNSVWLTEHVPPQYISTLKDIEL